MLLACMGWPHAPAGQKAVASACHHHGHTPPRGIVLGAMSRGACDVFQASSFAAFSCKVVACLAAGLLLPKSSMASSEIGVLVLGVTLEVGVGCAKFNASAREGTDIEACDIDFGAKFNASTREGTVLGLSFFTDPTKFIGDERVDPASLRSCGTTPQNAPDSSAMSV